MTPADGGAALVSEDARAALFGRYDGEEGGDVSPAYVARGGLVDPQNPDHWPWNVYTRNLTAPVVNDAAGRCCGWACFGEVADVRSNTLPQLTPFCDLCRRAGRRALKRRAATLATVGTWLRNARIVGRPAGSAVAR